jgi:hypothetical protein
VPTNWQLFVSTSIGWRENFAPSVCDLPKGSGGGFGGNCDGTFSRENDAGALSEPLGNKPKHFWSNWKANGCLKPAKFNASCCTSVYPTCSVVGVKHCKTC